MTRKTPLLVGVLAALALAACGSSTGGPAASANSTPTNEAQDPNAGQTPLGDIPATGSPTPDDTSAAVDTSAATATTAPDAAPSVAPLGSAALPGVPAVANATDLTKQPVAAKGTGDAPAGLVTRDLVVGTGASPTALTQSVDVHYAGSIFATGTVFDASWTDGAPGQMATFPLNMVIKGFGEGILGMKVGGRREIVIPPGDLGYPGGNSQAGIGATDTLIFIVDLNKVDS